MKTATRAFLSSVKAMKGNQLYCRFQGNIYMNISGWNSQEIVSKMKACLRATYHREVNKNLNGTTTTIALLCSNVRMVSYIH